MQLKFYYCRHCGKIIAIVKDSGIPTVCCGEAMQELVPGTTDGSSEKHIPVSKLPPAEPVALIRHKWPATNCGKPRSSAFHLSF